MRLAEQGSWEPALFATGVAAVLALWSAYAVSGADVIPPMPLLRPALIAIAAVCTVRGAALPVSFRLLPDRSPRFLIRSSGIVLALAAIHAAGIVSSGGVSG